jgi:hypothetical protein
MSSISPDFIHSVGCLYEEMNIQDQDFLNENSEYYDAEMSYLVEDILSTISTSMIYEGYSASAIIGFLADSSTQDILEKYLTFDENILLENTISEEYIQEQLEIFDYCIDEGLAGKLLGGAIKLAGRVASKPARSAVAKKMMMSKDPAKTAAAVDRLARMKMNKAGFPADMTKKVVDAAPNISGKTTVIATAPAVGKVVKGVQKVKDIASKAKTVLPKVAKGLGIFGLGAAGGYMGAKLAGGGGDGKVGPKIVGPKIVGPKIVGPKIVGPKSSSPSDGGGGSNSSGGGGGGGSSTPSSGSPKPAPAKPAAAKPTGTDMQQWAKANPTLAAKVKPGQSGYEDIQKLDLPQLNKPRPEQKQDQTPTQGPSTAKIDTKDVDNALKAEMERQKKRMEQQKNTSTTTKESYDAYEVVLEYLISTEQVETLDEAHYVMLEMDAETIGNIVGQYNTF